MARSESLSTKDRERAAGSAISVSLVAAMLSLLLFAWLAEEVLETDTARFDNFVRAAVHGWASPGLTSFMQAMTWIGSVKFLVAFVAVCVAVFLYARWRRAAFLLLIAVAGAIPLDAVLKVAFHRARPVPFFETQLPASYSFPSGHALFAFCIFGVLAAVTAARTSRIWLRVVIWAFAGAMVFLIGLSRIYLGVHYPSDVIAGYLAAAIWVSTIAAVDRWRRRRPV
ncbi:MAG TPA: phosphatase PAP2 family protein [Terriglobales bacterium]|nr:phosphatase PAP2 family protein [Terriglobales bacterium]